MTTISVKFRGDSLLNALTKVKEMPRLLDRMMGRISTESYRRFILTKIPKAMSKKRGGRRRSGFSGGQLRQSYKSVHRGFLQWEIYSPLADDQSMQTPYGYWQELGHTPLNSRVFKNYSTPGTGKHFIENAVVPTENLFQTTIQSKLDEMMRDF